MTGAAFGIGRIRWNWLAVAAVLLAALPLVSETYTPTLLAIWALFALSLGLMWGLRRHTELRPRRLFRPRRLRLRDRLDQRRRKHRAVSAGDRRARAVAAVIGAMMFYGRISDVYLGVITLVVTLILQVHERDGGRRLPHRQCAARRLQRHPGVSDPERAGRPEHAGLRRPPIISSVIVCLIGAYLVCRWILASAFGRILIGIRENESRMELLGYNVPAYKTAIFTVSGADGRPCRLPVRQLGRDRHAGRVQPRAVGRGHDLGDRRRPRHADRPDDRRGRARHAEARCSASRR